jgi:KaiC/GvpD/RAD55 family RecA-like ATPase
VNFLNLLDKRPEPTVNIYDNITLKGGEMVNIYGEPFSGKTPLCYWIINNNPDKTVFYFDTECSPYPFLEKTGKNIPIVYSNAKEIEKIVDIIIRSIDLLDYIVIDSLTGVILEAHEKRLLDMISVIKKSKKNLVVVSQLREYNQKKFYEHKKLLNFFSYKAEVKREGGLSVVNDHFVIDEKFLSKI